MMGANIVTSGSQYRLPIALLFLCFGSFRMDRCYFEIFNKIVFLNLTIDSSTRHSVIASIFTAQFHPPNNQLCYFIIRFVYQITFLKVL